MYEVTSKHLLHITKESYNMEGKTNQIIHVTHNTNYKFYTKLYDHRFWNFIYKIYIQINYTIFSAFIRVFI